MGKDLIISSNRHETKVALLEDEQLVEMYFQRATISSLAADLQSVNQADLVDMLWQWVSLVETMPASQSMVADPENYNLTFRTDGTYSAKADCNQLMGDYALQGSQLRLEPGISTMAACEPGSSYDLYRNLLDQVASVGMQDGVLVLVLAEDAGLMNFENQGPAPETTAPTTIWPGRRSPARDECWRSTRSRPSRPSTPTWCSQHPHTARRRARPRTSRVG